MTKKSDETIKKENTLDTAIEIAKIYAGSHNAKSTEIPYVIKNCYEMIIKMNDQIKKESA